MNYLKRWPIILVSFFFITGTVFADSGAGFLFEPYLGYGFQLAGKDDPNHGVNTTYHGVDLGARVGFRLGKFMIGIDGDYMSAKADYDGLGRSDVKKYNFGAMAGLIWGDFRLRAAWYWNSNWKFQDNLSGTYKGDGWGVGLTWKFMKYIALNVDYRMFKFDNGDAVSAFKPGELVFAISLPFDLGEMMYDDSHQADNDYWGP